MALESTPKTAGISGGGASPKASRPTPMKPTATVTKPHTGVAEPMYAPHARGLLGEQTMGFHLGSEGYHIIEGPSGTATFIDPATSALNGHQITGSGFDGVAFHPETKDLIIYDNKALQRSGNVSSASAITKNLEENLDKTIRKMEKNRSLIPLGGLPTFDQALEKMKAVRHALKNRQRLPLGSRIAISNAAGHSTGITEELRTGVTSTQVLQEFFYNSTRKLCLAAARRG